MKNWAKRVMAVVMTLGALLAPMAPVVMVAEPVFAAGDCVDTNLFGCVPNDEKGSGIKKLLSLVVSVLLYGIGAMAVIGVVVAGIMYLTARDNEAQVAKAKTRLIEVVIGLIAWAALFSILNWLIPGFQATDLNQNN